MKYQDRLILCPLLIAFLILGVIYGVVNPLFEAPDEIWHYAFVRNLATGGGLPVYKPGQETLFRQEGFQPPLYYFVSALTTFWIDTSDMGGLTHRNPHAAIGYPGSEGNKNLFLHSAQERFPYQNTSLAVHIARLVSLLLGAVTVTATYFTARELFPTERAVALGATAVVAFNPQFLFIHSAVNNDSAVTGFCAVVLLVGVLLLTRGASTLCLVGLGVSLGLALITKLNALPLLVWTVVALGCATLRRPLSRYQITRFLRSLTLVLGLAALLGGWWYLRNWLLYSNPLATEVWYEALGATGQPTKGLADLIAELGGLEISFWAVFGWMNVLADEWVYNAFRLLDRLAVLGLVFFVVMEWRKRRLPTATIRGIGLLGLWFLFTAVMLLRYMQTLKGAQGRLLFPAISAISLLLFLGLAQFVPRRHTGLLAGGLSIALFAVAAMVPWCYIYPAYAPPGNLTAQEIANIPYRLDIDFGGQMRLLGYSFNQQVVEPGQTIHLTLYWQSIAPMTQDYSVFVHLLDDLDTVVAQQDTYPGRGTRPTTQWAVGDSLADIYTLSLSPTTFAPTHARFEVGLYNYYTGERLLAQGPKGEALGDNVQFYDLTIPSTGTMPSPVGVFVNFQNNVALVAYDVDKRLVYPGDTIQLTLYWRSLTKVQENYTVFAHLLGKEGRIWAQDDRQEPSPTSLWEPGQIIEGDHRLVIPAETPPGLYDIEIGLYLRATGNRLSIVGENQQVLDNRVVLTRVRVRD